MNLRQCCTTPQAPLYPPLEEVRDISFKVALEVAREAQRAGLAEVDLDNLEQICERQDVGT